MPSFVLKAAPDADVYVEWSTVVDNLTAVGTRDSWPAERVQRADETGTSCKGFWEDGDGYAFGSWEDEDFIVTNTQRRDHAFFTLKRSDLLAYAQAHLADDAATAEALLTPVRYCSVCESDTDIDPETLLCPAHAKRSEVQDDAQAKRPGGTS